eukprot:8022575-Pyramimonas_sp.AAC.1
MLNPNTLHYDWLRTHVTTDSATDCADCSQSVGYDWPCTHTITDCVRTTDRVQPDFGPAQQRGDGPDHER